MWINSIGDLQNPNGSVSDVSLNFEETREIDTQLGFFLFIFLGSSFSFFFLYGCFSSSDLSKMLAAERGFFACGQIP